MSLVSSDCAVYYNKHENVVCVVRIFGRAATKRTDDTSSTEEQQQNTKRGLPWPLVFSHINMFDCDERQ